MERPATAVSYAASGSAVLFGMTANEFAAYCGVAIAALTFLANLWFRWRSLKIMENVAKEKPDCAVCPEREIEA